MRYKEVTNEQLEAARPGLALIEEVWDEPIYLYLYGLTSDKVALMDAREAIQESFDEEEADGRDGVPELVQVAIAIGLSDDTLHYLIGGGLKIGREEFSYTVPGEGARTTSFGGSGLRPRLKLSDFSKLAISNSDTWLDDFLTANTATAEVHPPVKRDEAATRQASATSIRNPIDSYLNS